MSESDKLPWLKSIEEVKAELAEAQDGINKILKNLQLSIDSPVNLTEIRSHSALFVILQVSYGAYRIQRTPAANYIRSGP